MKWILITGSQGGMGRSAVSLLSQNGFGVIALDLKPSEEADTELVKHVIADITDEASILSAMSEVLKITDSLYAVIHFAGIYMLDSLVEIDEGRMRKIFDVNFFGVYTVNRVFKPMLKFGSKIIITTSELATLPPLPFTGVYAISKAALDKYAYSLRMELQLLGVSVSVIRAGAVRTGMLSASQMELDKFLEKTELYKTNAKRFHSVVNAVESRSVSCERLARLVLRVVVKKSPRFAYSINRNQLLRLFGVAPSFIRFFAIRKILK